MVNRPYILSADDDPDDQFLIKQALTESGVEFDIDFVTDGVSFVERLLDHCMLKCPDLILLDINLPMMDGLEALKRVKEHEATKDVPVVVLTTTDRPYFLDKCNELGADQCLTKPDTFSELVKIMKNIVQSYFRLDS